MNFMLWESTLDIRLMTSSVGYRLYKRKMKESVKWVTFTVQEINVNYDGDGIVIRVE